IFKGFVQNFSSPSSCSEFPSYCSTTAYPLQSNPVIRTTIFLRSFHIWTGFYHKNSSRGVSNGGKFSHQKAQYRINLLPGSQQRYLIALAGGYLLFHKIFFQTFMP